MDEVVTEKESDAEKDSKSHKQQKGSAGTKAGATPDIVKILAKRWHWITLAAIFGIALWLRLIPLANYTKYLPDIDVYYMYRISGYVATHGLHLPALDVMRYFPTGFTTNIEFFGVYYIPAMAYVLINSITSISYLSFAKFFPAIMSCLAVVPLYLIGKEFHNKITGLLAAFLFAVSTAVMYRTSAALLEKEAVALVFMLFAVYFFIRAFKRSSLLSGINAGLSLAIFATVWGGVLQLYLVFAAFLFVMLLVNKYSVALLKTYIPLTLIGVFLPTVLMPALYLPRTTRAGALMIGLVLGVLILRDVVGRFKLVPKAKLPYFVPTTYILGGIALLIGSTFSTFFSSILFGIRQFLFFEKSVFGSTVAESQATGWGEFSSSLSPVAAQNLLPSLSVLLPILAVWLIAFAGLFILLHKIHSKKNWEYGVAFLFGAMGLLSYVMYLNNLQSAFQVLFVVSFIALVIAIAKKNDLAPFFVLLLFSSLLGAITQIRLLFLVGIFGSLFAAYAISSAISYISKMPKIAGAKTVEEKIGNVWSLSAIAVVGLILVVNFAAGYTMASSIGPSFNDNWNDAMNFMKTNTTTDSVILSWWDFGYWFQTMGERPSNLDGGNQFAERNIPTAQFFTGMMNDNQQRFFLQKMGTDYIIVDGSMVGKYPAMSSIGSGGKNIEAFSTFYRGQDVKKDNRTILVYEAGLYSILVPVSAEGGLAGNVVLSTPRGDAYIKNICTTTGIFEVGSLNESTNAVIDGCVFVMPQYLLFATKEISTSVFTRLYLMDGLGIDYAEKVFDNGEVKIYKVDREKIPEESVEDLRAWWASHDYEDLLGVHVGQ